MYSPGNALVVYEMSKHVLPTAPSPTTTHLMFCIYKMVRILNDRTVEELTIADNLEEGGKWLSRRVRPLPNFYAKFAGLIK